MSVQPGRNYGLDLLRAIAIAMVLANHYFLGLHVSSGRVAWEGTAAGISVISFLAIEWLFVLSGFLIGTMMIRSFESGRTWWARARDFWLRRWFRTLPNYYLFLLVNGLLVAVGIGPGVFSAEFLYFSQNLAWPERAPLFYGEAWSLALDEWFYLVMPLLLGLAAWLLRLEARRAFLFVALTLILLPTLGRFAITPPTEFLAWDAAVRRVTVLHLDATGWGVLSAIASRWYPAYWASRRGTKALAGGLLTVLGVVVVEVLVFGGWPAGGVAARLLNAVSLVFPALGAFLLLPWLARLPLPSGPVAWIVDRISLYSYSLYLCHLPVILLVEVGFGVNRATPLPLLLLASAVWLGGTLLISALVFHSFEKPVARLRDRYTRQVSASPFEPPPSPAPVDLPAASRTQQC